VTAVPYEIFIERSQLRDFDLAYCLYQAPFDTPSSYLYMYLETGSLSWSLDPGLIPRIRSVIEEMDSIESDAEACALLKEFEVTLLRQSQAIPVTLTDALYLSRHPRYRYCKMGRLRFDMNDGSQTTDAR